MEEYGISYLGESSIPITILNFGNNYQFAFIDEDASENDEVEEINIARTIYETLENLESQNLDEDDEDLVAARQHFLSFIHTSENPMLAVIFRDELETQQNLINNVLLEDEESEPLEKISLKIDNVDKVFKKIDTSKIRFESVCCICLDKDSSIGYVHDPVLHIVTCEDCFKYLNKSKIVKCPICNIEIKNVIKTC